MTDIYSLGFDKTLDKTGTQTQSGVVYNTNSASYQLQQSTVNSQNLLEGGAVHSGMTTYMTGTGFWLGLIDGVAKLSIGDPAGNYIAWDGSQLLTRSTVSTLVTLTDAANVTLDALAGDVFYLSAGGNRTLLAPTNPVDGRAIIIRHYANGGARTLTLTTGSAGAFRFGTDVTTALSVTDSGAMDYIGCIYNGVDARWDVVAYSKGY